MHHGLAGGGRRRLPYKKWKHLFEAEEGPTIPSCT